MRELFRRALYVVVFVLISGLILPAAARARTLVVDQRRSQASDAGAGAEKAPFKTINAAAQLAQPGDTVLVHAGIYRERIAPPRGGAAGNPITYQAARGERVFVRGSEVLNGPFQPVQDHAGVFTVKIDPAVFEKRPDGTPYNAFAISQRGGAQTRTLGQVFLDGKPLTEVDSVEQVYAQTNTWRAVPDGQELRINFGQVADPSTHLVEIGARRRIFAPYLRGLGYITIRGFTFEHACNESNSGFYDRGAPPQAGAVGTRSGHHWVIEDNTIRFAKSIGLDIGSENESRTTVPCKHCGSFDGPPGTTEQPTPTYVGYHTIRNNQIVDNGEIGITGLGHIETQIIGNVIARNNALVYRNLESGAIKFHLLLRGRIEGNLIADNQGWGLWLDNVWQDTRVTRNVFINNAGAGIFMELGTGFDATIDNNVIVNTRVHPGGTGRDNFGSGAGIYSHDASGILIANNLIAGSEGYGLFLRVSPPRDYQTLPRDITDFAQRAGRVGMMSEVSDLQVLGNLIVANRAGAMSLPYASPRARRNASDANLIGPNQTFTINNSAGPSMDEILAAIDKAMPGNTIGRDVRTMLATNRQAAATPAATNAPAGRGRGRRTPPPPLQLTLDQWRTTMGFGAKSRVLDAASVSVDRDGDRVILRTKLSAVPILGPVSSGRLTQDLLGRPIPVGKVKPGPIQALKAGDQKSVLWPMPN